MEHVEVVGSGTGMGKLRVALYSPGMVGLGHVRRNILISQALATSPLQPTQLVIAEARQASSFPMPADSDLLTLPALRKDVDGQSSPRYLEGVPLHVMGALRSNVIRAALDAFDPDALIVDHLPRGAHLELEPALKLLRARGRTRFILGLRDVLEDPLTVRREWSAAGNEKAILDYYDAVWVYGDPRVYDLVREYGLLPQVAARVRYTGYLDSRERLKLAGDLPDPLATLGLPEGRLVLCLVGGGQDGHRLAQAAAPPRRVRELIDLNGLKYLPGLLAEVLATPVRLARANALNNGGIRRVAA